MLKIPFGIALFLCIIVIILGVRFFFAKQQEGTLRVVPVRVGSVTFQAEVADTLQARSRGLSGRQTLGEDECMLFVFNLPAVYTFWMRGMRFPIDIIWIAEDTVVGFTERVSPEGKLPHTVYHPPVAVDRVLEVRAGEVARRGIQVGDQVTVLVD